MKLIFVQEEGGEFVIRDVDRIDLKALFAAHYAGWPPQICAIEICRTRLGTFFYDFKLHELGLNPVRLSPYLQHCECGKYAFRQI